MSGNPIPFATVEEALEEIRQGRQIVLVDDEDRENEGDLCIAADKITPEAINFMAKNGRGLVCLALTEERCQALDLLRPGHVFPLRAPKGGVLKRAGQTEASVDLASIAGMTTAAVICEIMNEDGTMARMPDLRQFALHHGLKIISVADIIKYRMQHEKHVHCLASPRLPTPYGEFRVHAYKSDITGEEDAAVVV